MPTYVYACQVCRQVVERRQSFRDDPLTMCEQCGGELRRVIQPVGIIFKGSGSSSSDHEAASTATIPEPAGVESSSTESSSDVIAPATAPAESAPAKDATGPTKESSEPAAAKPPSKNSDDGHRPAQRGSRWTTFIK